MHDDSRGLRPANQHIKRRNGLALMGMLLMLAAQGPAQAADARVSVEVKPYFRIGTGIYARTEGASLLGVSNQGVVSRYLGATTVPPPDPRYSVIAQGLASAYANAPGGSLGALARAAYFPDASGQASANATIESGPISYSGGRLVISNGLYWNYLGQLRLTLHGNIDGIASGGLQLSGFNLAGGSIGIRNNGFGEAQVSCDFGGGGRGCTERSVADLSGDRAFTTATWHGIYGPSFSLVLSMPLLVDPYRDNFTMNLSLGAFAQASNSFMTGSSIDMLNTSTLSFTPWEGVTVNFGEQFLSAVPEPAAVWLWLAGGAAAAFCARRRSDPGV